VYVGHPTAFDEVAGWWRRSAPRLGELDRLPDPAQRSVRAIKAYLQSVRPSGGFVNLLVPETLTGRSMLQFLRRRSALWLKASLLFQPGIVVTDIPLLATGMAAAESGDRRPLEPRRHVVLVPVSAVHAGVARAILYAKSLHAGLVEAVFFSSDPEDLPSIQAQWAAWHMDIPLALIDAPFRDVRGPLLDEIRGYTRRGDTVVTVVMPEFVVDNWWEHLLHNQVGLYIKRALLFEPSVVVTSVPTHLGAAEAGRRDVLTETA
jgi:hypothetical protein